jgi:hypothetical protein
VKNPLEQIEKRIAKLEAIAEAIGAEKYDEMAEHAKELSKRFRAQLYRVTVMTEVARYARRMPDSTALQVHRGMADLLDEDDAWWSRRDAKELTIGQFTELALRRSQRAPAA